MNVITLRDEWDKVKKYFYDTRWYHLCCFILFVFVYGTWMFNTNPRIDTEVVINNPHDMVGWPSIGRYGLIFTEYIFGLRWYNPFISTGIGFVLLFFSGMIFGYLFWRAGQGKYWIYAAFGILFLISPIMVEQLYFDLQLFQIAWAYCICAAGVALSYLGIWIHSAFWKILAIFCMVWAFSSYQAFTMIYMAAAITFFVLFYKRFSAKEESKNKVLYGKIVVWQISLFLIAMIVNSVIANVIIKKFSQNSQYLNNMVQWSTQGTIQCLKNIEEHIINGLIGSDVFYTSFFGICILILFVYLIIQLIQKNKKSFWWLFCLAIIGLQLSPFLLTIYTGAVPALRAQISYPFVLACDILLITNLLDYSHYKKIKIIPGLILMILFLWTQMNPTMRLIYTDKIRAQEDIRVAQAIDNKINEISQAEKPVAFVGVYQNQLNAACVRGELIGMSILNWDSGAMPHYWSSSRRICTLAQTLGFSLKNVNETQMIEARNIALNMPNWPQEGSIVDAGDYIVVKLSEDQWPEEILDSKIYETTAPSTDGTLKYSVDSVQIANGTLSIRGWMIQEGVLSDSLLPTVYLQEKNTQNCYQLSTAKVYRPDLEEAFENGQLYTNGGFVSVASVDMLESPIEDYELILALENSETGEKHAVSTNYQWPAELVK